MNISDSDFEPKGPSVIRARMAEIKARLDSGRRAEFQDQLNKANEKKVFDDGTPLPLTGKIGGGGGDSKLGPLPPADPENSEEFTIAKGNPTFSQSGKMEVQGLISQVAREQNVDQALLRAVVEAESDFNPNEVSRTGAVGLMQLMPGTAKELGVADPYNPYDNLTGGAKYLNTLLKRYHGDVSMALAAYNAGPGNVDKAKGIPNFPETQKYVNRIMTQIGKQ